MASCKSAVNLLLAPVMCICLVTSHGLHISMSHDVNPQEFEPSARLHDWSLNAPGEVRCFCNLPECIGTGYMCKSPILGCFSDLLDYVDVYKARHGCLELINSDKQEKCQNVPGAGRGHPRSLLLCCRKDMCNHVDSPEIRLRFNDTFTGPGLNNSDGLPRIFLNSGGGGGGGVHPPAVGYASNDVWFKAATIAVPICGGLILLVLIALAVRILRRERDPTHHGFVFPHHPDPTAVDKRRQSFRQRNEQVRDLFPDKKRRLPLLCRNQHDGPATPADPATRYADKNETNAKLNSVSRSCRTTPTSGDYTLLVAAPTSGTTYTNLHKPNNCGNLYRNVNLALAVPTHNSSLSPCGGKLYDKRQLAAVNSWGTPTSHANQV